mgnify:CR=1 FL=1
MLGLESPCQELYRHEARVESLGDPRFQIFPGRRRRRSCFQPAVGIVVEAELDLLDEDGLKVAVIGDESVVDLVGLADKLGSAVVVAAG